MASPNQPHFSGATSAGGAAAEKGRETSNISRLNPNQLKNQEQIIHRTKNCIIVAGQNKRDDQEPKNKLCGYSAPRDQAYVPMGIPVNVIPVILGLREVIKYSTHEMTAETQKIIHDVSVRKTSNPLFPPDNRPERTLRILQKEAMATGGLTSGPENDFGKKNFPQQRHFNRKRGGKQKIDFSADRIAIQEEGGAAKIHERMQDIEQQFMSNPLNHDQTYARKTKDAKKHPSGAGGGEEDGEEGGQGAGKGEYEQFNNQRLMTPRMRKLMNNKDARELLQEEINESVLRLKQAKFGHRLVDIVPDHQNSFYLPEKSVYLPGEKKRGVDTGATQSNFTASKSNFASSSHARIAARSNTNMSRTAQKALGLPQSPQQSRRVEAPNQRAYSSINNDVTSSLFLTEPGASAFPPPTQLMAGQGGPYGNMAINHNIFQQSISKALAGQHMSSAQRASAFHSAAGTTDETPAYHKYMQNSQLSHYAPNASISKTGHTTFGATQFNSSFNNRNVQRFDRREASTLSSAGNTIFGKVKQIRKQGHGSASVNDPYQARQAQSVQLMSSQQMLGMPPMKDPAALNKSHYWKKAIEKFSPKKSTKLNEVSLRFQMKLEEANKVQAKREGKSVSAATTAATGQAGLGRSSVLRGDDDADKIKFVSMIDQKPIKPSYLELIPLKNFAKKETELTRKQAKEFTSKPESNDKQSAFSDVKSLFKLLSKELKETYTVHEQELEAVKKAKEDEYRKAIGLRRSQEAQGALTKEQLEKAEQDEYKEIYTDAALALRERVRQLEDAKLDKPEDMLLGKLIDFKAVWDYDSVEIRSKLYKLFFDWRELKTDLKAAKVLKAAAEAGDKKDDKAKEEGAEEGHANEEGQSQANNADAEQEKMEERKKRQQLRLDQELQDFDDRGGFAQVLKDIFNPTDQASMELDSVYQLKQLCKAFYEKKENLSKELVQCLDALANERPWTVKAKKKHFDTSSNNLLTDVEYMRINAERERIKKYQEITKGSAYTYYKILKDLTEYTSKALKEQHEQHRDPADPQAKIKLALRDAKLKNLLAYITDFIKQVVENGNTFSKSHYFMLLMNLTPAELEEPMIVASIKIITSHLEVTEFDYVQFNQKLKDPALQKAYFDICPKIFGDE